MSRPSIAIIGSGIAGLGAAWLLQRAFDLRMFEAEPRIGGHSNTVEVNDGSGAVSVHTGFIVFNPVNYPNLTSLFELLDVPTAATDMSFSVCVDRGRLEYSGTNLAGLFAQRRNLLRPSFHRMLLDIVRFNRAARASYSTTCALVLRCAIITFCPWALPSGRVQPPICSSSRPGRWHASSTTTDC